MYPCLSSIKVNLFGAESGWLHAEGNVTDRYA
jgi:hypothetical protein